MDADLGTLVQEDTTDDVEVVTSGPMDEDQLMQSSEVVQGPQVDASNNKEVGVNEEDKKAEDDIEISEVAMTKMENQLSLESINDIDSDASNKDNQNNPTTEEKLETTDNVNFVPDMKTINCSLDVQKTDTSI